MPLQSLANRQSLWLLAAPSLVAVGVGAVVVALTDNALRRNVKA